MMMQRRHNDAELAYQLPRNTEYKPRRRKRDPDIDEVLADVDRMTAQLDREALSAKRDTAESSGDSAYMKRTPSAERLPCGSCEELNRELERVKGEVLNQGGMNALHAERASNKRIRRELAELKHEHESVCAELTQYRNAVRLIAQGTEGMNHE